MLWLPGLIFIVAWTSRATEGHSVQKRAASDMKIVCYYSNWAIYRPGLAKFTPENINPFLCTHIIYAFAGMNKDYELKPFDSYNDIQQGNYKKFVGLKTYNPKLKALLAVGGWNEGSKRFSKLVESYSTRQKFVRSAVRFLRQHHFDGLDLDWEYPAFRDGASDGDREGYAKLVQELREAFDEETSPGKHKLLLSIAVPAGQQYIDKGFDVVTISRHVDFMSILSYDYHTAHEPQTNHHAPLARPSDDSSWDWKANLNVEWTVNHYLRLGAAREKLLVGIPTYGRSYTLQDPADNGLEAPTDGPGEKGVSTREKGYLAYYEICQKIQDEGWEMEVPYPKVMGPYAYKDDQWVGFDDEDIIIEKAKFIVENGLGGAMVWTLDNDDFRGTCYEEQSPLITTLRTALLANTIEGSSSERDDRRSSEVSSSRPRYSDEEVVRPKPKTSSGRRRGRVLASDDDDDYVTTPRTRASTRLPTPPPTPDPGPPFECPDEGFYNNPRDCRKYFWCLDSGPSELGIVPHAFTCPSGLFFNSRRDSCDYPENVACRVTTTTAAPTTKAPKRRLRPHTVIARVRQTTTSAPRSTTERSVKLPKQLNNDLASLSGPLNKALSNSNQNILELLRILDSVGGIDGLQEMLKTGEKVDLSPTTTKALTTTTPAPIFDSSPVTIPPYGSPKRRRTSTTTPVPSRTERTSLYVPEYTQPPYRPATLRQRVRQSGATDKNNDYSDSEYRRRTQTEAPVTFTYAQPNRPQVRPSNVPQEQEQDGYIFVYHSPNRTRGPEVIPEDQNTHLFSSYQSPLRPQHGSSTLPSTEGDTVFVYSSPPREQSGERVVQVQRGDSTGSRWQDDHRVTPEVYDRSTPDDVYPRRDSQQTESDRAVQVRGSANDGVRRRVVISRRRQTQSPNGYQPASSDGVVKLVRPISTRVRDSRTDPTYAIGGDEEVTTFPTVRRVRPGYTQSIYRDANDGYISDVIQADFSQTSPRDFTDPPASFNTPQHVAPSGGRRRRPTTRARLTTTTTTTPRPPTRQRPTSRRPTPRTSAPLLSDVPPLYVLADNQIECQKQGMFPHPQDCTSFIVCARSPRSSSGFRSYIRTCPANQYYEPLKGRCLPRDATSCKSK